MAILVKPPLPLPLNPPFIWNLVDEKTARSDFMLRQMVWQAVALMAALVSAIAGDAAATLAEEEPVLRGDDFDEGGFIPVPNPVYGASQHNDLGVKRQGTKAAQRRAILVVFALAATLAISFAILRCYKALAPRQGANSAARRLAGGGPGCTDPGLSTGTVTITLTTGATETYSLEQILEATGTQQGFFLKPIPRPLTSDEAQKLLLTGHLASMVANTGEKVYFLRFPHVQLEPTRRFHLDESEEGALQLLERALASPGSPAAPVAGAVSVVAPGTASPMPSSEGATGGVPGPQPEKQLSVVTASGKTLNLRVKDLIVAAKPNKNQVLKLVPRSLTPEEKDLLKTFRRLVSLDIPGEGTEIEVLVFNGPELRPEERQHFTGTEKENQRLLRQLLDQYRPSAHGFGPQFRLPVPPPSRLPVSKRLPSTPLSPPPSSSAVPQASVPPPSASKASSHHPLPPSTSSSGAPRPPPVAPSTPSGLRAAGDGRGTETPSGSLAPGRKVPPPTFPKPAISLPKSGPPAPQPAPSPAAPPSFLPAPGLPSDPHGKGPTGWKPVAERFRSALKQRKPTGDESEPSSRKGTAASSTPASPFSPGTEPEGGLPPPSPRPAPDFQLVRATYLPAEAETEGAGETIPEPSETETAAEVLPPPPSPVPPSKPFTATEKGFYPESSSEPVRWPTPPPPDALPELPAFSEVDDMPPPPPPPTSGEPTGSPEASTGSLMPGATGGQRAPPEGALPQGFRRVPFSPPGRGGAEGQRSPDSPAPGTRGETNRTARPYKKD